MHPYLGALYGVVALFGTGWGIAGYCLGPALASRGIGVPAPPARVACMVVGWWLAACPLPPTGENG